MAVKSRTSRMEPKRRLAMGRTPPGAYHRHPTSEDDNGYVRSYITAVSRHTIASECGTSFPTEIRISTSCRQQVRALPALGAGARKRSRIGPASDFRATFAARW
jgi:hypothetical protein